MATAVLTNTPTVISLCESITGWSGDTFILDSGVKVQGSNSVSCAMTTNGTNNIQYATTNAPGGEFDATDIHIRFWFYLEFMGNIDSEANDGIQVQVISDAGTALYTVLGGDTYDGGFVQAVIYTGDTPTSGSAPTTNCSTVGLTVNTTSKPRNVPSNCYIDAMYFGDGYTVTGGTSGDEIDWSHIAALDLTNRYGIVTDINGIYFLKGAVTIGTSTTTWFKSGQKVQFADSATPATFSSTLFELNFAGSGLRADITGGSIGVGGTQDYLFDASDAAIVAFDMTGVQFAKANSILFESVADVQNCVFDDCGQVVSDDCTFKFNSFANCTATDGAFLWPADDSNVSDLSFAICDNDIEYDDSSDGTPSFSNILHDDNAGDYDVNNTGTSIVTIPLTGTSNGNSYQGTYAVTFSASVTLTFTVKDQDTGAAIESARINIVNASTKAELYQIETNASGIATQSHTYAGELGIEGWVRQYDLISKEYVPKPFSGTIISTGFSTTVTLILLNTVTYGSDVMVNGTFAADTNWTKRNSSTISGGVGHVTANGNLDITGTNWSLETAGTGPFATDGVTRYYVTFRARQITGSGNFQVHREFFGGFTEVITGSWVNYGFISSAHATYDDLVIGGGTIGDTFEVDDIVAKAILT